MWFFFNVCQIEFQTCGTWLKKSPPSSLSLFTSFWSSPVFHAIRFRAITSLIWSHVIVLFSPCSYLDSVISRRVSYQSRSYFHLNLFEFEPNWFFFSTSAGVGLVLLPVCHIHQPAVPAAGVLLSFQEEEDPWKVRFLPTTTKKKQLMDFTHTTHFFNTHCLFFFFLGMGTWGWWWDVRSSACGRI